MDKNRTDLDYEILDHPADLKVRAYGSNLSELFSNMLKGMFQSCRPVIDNKKLLVNREIKVKADNIESLLINFLSEALYLSDINNETYFDAEFKRINEKGLIAKIKGKKVKRFSLEIKAVTWHDLEVKKENDLWQATVLFDI